MIARSQQGDFASRVGHYRARVNDQLARALTDEQMPGRLREAMRYSVLGEGKRVRLQGYSQCSGTPCALAKI